MRVLIKESDEWEGMGVTGNLFCCRIDRIQGSFNFDGIPFFC